MKRALTAPLVGLGLGATALGGASYVGGSTRCNEGRVVESLAQCQSIVGAASANVCATAFSAFSPAAEQASLTGPPPAIADRAVFLTTQPNGAPTAQPVTRAAGDPKWRGTNGSVMDAFRNGCSRSSGSSGAAARSASRSSWSSWGGSGVNNSGARSGSSAISAVSRGGFGSSGRSSGG